jgi:ribosomal protein S18 acetylase RimI-like enzyme
MIEVRRASSSDAASLAELLAAQLSEHGLAAQADQIWRGIAVAFDADAPFLVATEAGHPVGVCLANRIASVEHGGAVWFIEELYVSPGVRRRGVARALLRRLFADGRAAGVRAFELELAAGHEAARALYRSLGFRENARTSWALAAD